MEGIPQGKIAYIGVSNMPISGPLNILLAYLDELHTFILNIVEGSLFRLEK